MIERLSCPSRCRDIVIHQREYFTFDEDKWFEDRKNYALIEGDNIAFAEEKSEGVHWVHLCFNSARGREAIQLAEKMTEIFVKQRDVKTLVGAVHRDNKKMRAIVRKMGMTPLGSAETTIGWCELYFRSMN